MHYFDSHRTFAKLAREELFVPSPYDVSSMIREILPSRPDTKPFLEKYKPDISETYRLFHQRQQPAFIAAKRHIQELGYDVHNNKEGAWFLGILKNGPGTTILLHCNRFVLRDDSNGTETTAKQDMKEISGFEDRCHACELTGLMSVAELLHRAMSEWSGNLVILLPSSPDPKRVPITNRLWDQIREHNMNSPTLYLNIAFRPPSGPISVITRPALSRVEHVKVRVFRNEDDKLESVDPILLASSILNRLQRSVSQELAPNSVADITCTSINSNGSIDNSIPKYVEFELNVRATSLPIRGKALALIKQVVSDEAQAAGAERMPQLTFAGDQSNLAVDETEKLTKLLQEDLVGENWEIEVGPEEDTARFGQDLASATPHSIYLRPNEKGKRDFISNERMAAHTSVVDPAFSALVDHFSLVALKLFQ